WPVEPPPSRWRLPDPRRLPEEDAAHDLLAVGADLSPSTILAAYRRGLFPMHVWLPDSEDAQETDEQRVTDVPRQIGWWSPDPRGVLPIGRLRISRSLRRSMRRFDVTVDTAFDDVVAGCADRDRPDGWINRDITSAYQRLHQAGWAHSIEIWSDDLLVGGLYGVVVGGLFAGESMFHREADASKVALVHLDRWLTCDGQPRLLDVQWVTPHLTSLGALALPRSQYLDQLDAALLLPTPPVFAQPPRASDSR
ncbi:MAG: leucyl/phenylalanyl-tRNA--protein transferase, partial [Candidatus Nanopelagicales bacterium]